jgi:hypothetical protein
LFDTVTVCAALVVGNPTLPNPNDVGEIEIVPAAD